MAYRFNSGMGGVTCDVCNRLIDQGLSYAEYEATWGKHGDDGDICMTCKKGKKERKCGQKAEVGTQGRGCGHSCRKHIH